MHIYWSILEVPAWFRSRRAGWSPFSYVLTREMVRQASTTACSPGFSLADLSAISLDLTCHVAFAWRKAEKEHGSKCVQGSARSLPIGNNTYLYSTSRATTVLCLATIEEIASGILRCSTIPSLCMCCQMSTTGSFHTRTQVSGQWLTKSSTRLKLIQQR